MKRKSLVLIVLLLCLASMMAAMAYTSAEVKTGYTVRVVNDDEALLALIPNGGDADGTAYINASGDLVLDFGRVGNNGNFSGLQPGSTYKWDGLVRLKNNSQNKIKVNVSVDGVAAQYLTIVDSKGKEVKNLNVNANNSEALSFEISLPKAMSAGTPLTGNIVVSASVS